MAIWAKRTFLVAREFFEFAGFARHANFPLKILLGGHVHFRMSVQTLSSWALPLFTSIPRKRPQAGALASSPGRSHCEAGQILRNPFVSCIGIIFTNTWPNKRTQRGTHAHQNMASTVSILLAADLIIIWCPPIKKMEGAVKKWRELYKRKILGNTRWKKVS